MRKLVTAAVAAGLMIPTAMPAFAQSRHEIQRDRHDIKQDRKELRRDRKDYRKWRKGERFDRRYARDYRVVNYRQYRHLYAPPRGYQWVRSGNDAVLVGITSGLIAAVLANQF